MNRKTSVYYGVFSFMGQINGQQGLPMKTYTDRIKTLDIRTFNWIGAVSYTHLDVYKRQGLQLTHKNRECNLLVYYLLC